MIASRGVLPMQGKILKHSARRTLLFLFAFSGASLSLLAVELTKPRIEVFKSRRELRLFDGEQLFKTYRVALGTNPVPAKTREGDRATPEGSYFICLKNPRSKFHLSLAISYPGPEDARRGRKADLISEEEAAAIVQAHAERKAPPWNTRLGGEVFIHGHGAAPDWTHGCIALDDGDIEELYRLVPVQTPITIFP